MNGLVKKLILPAALGMLLQPSVALAVTQCQVNVRSLFTGDDGSLWIFFTNGGGARIAKSDPDFEMTGSFALSALLASRELIARYAADGVACTDPGRSDLVGLYIQ